MRGYSAEEEGVERKWTSVTHSLTHSLTHSHTRAHTHSLTQ